MFPGRPALFAAGTRAAMDALCAKRFPFPNFDQGAPPMTQLIDPSKRHLAPRGLATPHGAEVGADLPAKVIANTSTPVPQGQGTFSFMTYPQASAGAVAFNGAGKEQPSNIYQTVGGQLRLALAVGAPIPSTGGTFTDF